MRVRLRQVRLTFFVKGIKFLSLTLMCQNMDSVFKNYLKLFLKIVLSIH